ncbi:MAG: GNAT family N-acetyltransferase [Clostridiales bacterium 38-18]|nr:MAG: GNAT family N-acetyltransferase [Clostridiales bacterium 38-18]
MKIIYETIPCTEAYLDDLTSMAIDLWPENEFDELKASFEKLITSKKDRVFIAILEDLPIGFVHVSVRSDYVEGSSSTPVGYIEGVYVCPEFRKKRVSKALIEKAEYWAKGMGCTELASDVIQDNESSILFHKSIGFREVNRIVCFIKDIEV